MNVLTMKNVKKSFGEVEVLRDISLTVEEGQVLAIIGPSGSGKSTLLRCATLLTEMTDGTLMYLDQTAAESVGGKAVYAGKEQLKKVRSVFGLVFQNFNLFPHYSVLKNLTDAQITVLGRSKEEAEEKAHALLKKMGLDDKANVYPYQLSGGQQQRVAIARALAMDPKILFFDEPTSALDPELTGEVLKIIRELAHENMTMVIVTHEMAFARDVAEHVIFMDGGVIVEQGDPHQVIDHPTQARTRQFLQRYSQD
ncbi:MAG: amino acid ABC transporter ATP-binding protein [Clostridia bacterium]|nr:amino acid ABC transporter ATP-binding protein [Clostridia bacterium]